MMLPTRFRRVMQCVAVAAAVSFLSGCGGGVSVGGGYYDNYPYDVYPPQVSITASSGIARAGSYVNVSAAAVDESGIYDVIIYRLDGSTPVELAHFYNQPYQLAVFVPVDGRPYLDLYADASDNAGRIGESQVIRITITP